LTAATAAALVCDTSGLLAALDRSDPDHSACVATLTGHDGPLLMSPLVLAELDHLVRRRLGVEAARRLADDVAAGAYDLAVLTADDVAACVRLDRSYADLGLGLTDASLVVLAARVGTTSLLTLDERHLRAVRPLQGGAFRLYPEDR
jgi:predicted nucleic acid-binding protein